MQTTFISNICFLRDIPNDKFAPFFGSNSVLAVTLMNNTRFFFVRFPQNFWIQFNFTSRQQQHLFSSSDKFAFLVQILAV